MNVLQPIITQAVKYRSIKHNTSISQIDTQNGDMRLSRKGDLCEVIEIL